MVVIVSLCASLLACWTEAPVWLPYALAVALVSLALILMATRSRGGQPEIGQEQPGSGWLAHELAGNGSPAGTYPLAFFGAVTIALTGFQGAYAAPAWAALALTAAWAVANARYPSDDGPDA